MTRSAYLLAIAIVAHIGCGDTSHPVPPVHAAGGYAVAPFKDDAPANARPADDTFPKSFVDRFGNPVDLTKYKGKQKVVLVVLRGIPLSTPTEFCPSCLAQVSSLLANQADAMVYSVTKAGLISLTKSEAIDLAPMGIRAVAICPGSVETPLVERAIEQMARKSHLTADEQRRIWEAQYPTGRFSTPEEVADLTLFLCSERARNISGSAVIIDGGLTAVLPER